MMTRTRATNLQALIGTYDDFGTRSRYIGIWIMITAHIGGCYYISLSKIIASGIEVLISLRTTERNTAMQDFLFMCIYSVAMASFAHVYVLQQRIKSTGHTWVSVD